MPNKLLIATLVLAGACGRSSGPSRLSSGQALDTAVQPSALVASLRARAGAHYQATLSFRVSPTGEDASSKDAITTTTDLWLDPQGNFRLLESNDQDGGREVVRVGNELGVALRHAKMIRRPAQEPEPQHLLEEAVGQPFAAYDVVARFIATEGTGPSLRLVRQPHPGPVVPASTDLKKWHESVEVDSLGGEALLGPEGLQAFSLKARFHARRDQQPIEGEIAVEAKVDQVGAVAPVSMPKAEPLPVRQRTILEERALLAGLGGRVTPPAAKKAAAAKRAAPGKPAAPAAKLATKPPVSKPAAKAPAAAKAKP